MYVTEGHRGTEPPLATEDLERLGVPLDWRRLVRDIRRAKRTFLVTLVVGTVVGGAVGKLLVPKEFEATTILVARAPEGDAKTEGKRQVRTLADSIKLPTVLGRVREDLGLAVTLEALGRDLSVTTSAESDLVSLHVRAPEAQLAVRIADRTAAVFVDERLRAERARLSTRLGALDDGVTRARAAFDDARRAFDAFRKDHGISDLSTETHVAIEMAARLKSDEAASTALANSERARGKLLKDTLRTEPMMTLLAEQQVDPGAQKLAELDAELRAESGRLSAKHPKVQALSASTRALQAGLVSGKGATPVARTNGRSPRWETLQQGLATSASEEVAASERRRSLEGMVARAQGEVKRLAAIEGRAVVLLGESRQAEAHLRDLELMHSRAAEEARSAAADVSILSPATRPQRPLKATGRLVALALPAAMTFLATCVIVGKSLAGLRAHTPGEVSFWGRGPTLAACGTTGADASRQVAADLGSLVRKARGQTLIVPAGEEERTTAEELVARLTEPPDGADPKGASGVAASSIPVFVNAHDAVSLRRQARAAARIVVVIAAGKRGAGDLGTLRRRLGRETGVGFVVSGLGADSEPCEDRIGNAEAFFGVEHAS